MYTVKEIFYTLQGEGAQAGMSCGVSALHGLQSLDGTRAGPCARSLHVLRYGFCRDRDRMGDDLQTRPRWRRVWMNGGDSEPTTTRSRSGSMPPQVATST